MMKILPAKREQESLAKLIEMARVEDLGSGGDITSAILPNDCHATGKFVARQPMVLCGGAMLEAIALSYDAQLRTKCLIDEGEHIPAGCVLATWDGPARAMMSAERVALNFLQRLSGVATTTADYVQAVAGTAAEIFDTRKTTPGWRDLEKYAVRVGGGRNHRYGLYDAVLIKDNHLAVLAKAEGCDPMAALGRELARLRPTLSDTAFVELEVDTLDQFAVALGLPVDIILLDNMTTDQLRKAVAMRADAGLADQIELEASGGITLENIPQVADTGVERIAVGAVTHSAGVVDIALDIQID